MKYIDKYPDMKPIHDERNGIIKCDAKYGKCHYCKNPTEFVEINYEAPFCSEECLNTWETEFFEKYQ